MQAEIGLRTVREADIGFVWLDVWEDYTCQSDLYFGC